MVTYEDTLTRDELLARVKDQNRIIDELYKGEHGVHPHPSEVYAAGLWEIYKVDEHQGHAEKVGEVGELAQLRSENERLQKLVDYLKRKVEADELPY